MSIPDGVDLPPHIAASVERMEREEAFGFSGTLTFEINPYAAAYRLVGVCSDGAAFGCEFKDRSEFDDLALSYVLDRVRNHLVSKGIGQ